MDKIALHYSCLKKGSINYLCSNHFSGAGLQEFALAPSALDGGTGRFRKGVGLDSNVLGTELFASDNDFVGVELGLGDGLALEEGIEIAGFSGCDAIERIQVNQIVFLLGVSGSHGLSDVLGQSAV